MYVIKCISKLGQVRYLRNKPLGSTKLLWSASNTTKRL